jgi:hypothetical protein
MNKAEEKELDKASELSDKGHYAEAITRLEVLQTSALNYLADAYAGHMKPYVEPEIRL